MGARLTYSLVVLIAPAGLLGQDPSSAKPAPPAAAGTVEPPLPPGAVQRLGDTRFRPGARIKHLVFSPDGTRLASWGNWLYFEDRLSIWDTATGREVYTRPMPEGHLADLGWRPDGGLAVLTTAEGFRVWAFADAAGKYPAPAGDDAGGKKPAVPKAAPAAPLGAVTNEMLTLSVDGQRLASFRTGGTVHVSEAKPCASGSELKQVAVCDRMPAGKCSGLRFAAGGKVVCVLVDSDKGPSAVVWNTETGTVSEPVAVASGVRQGQLQSFDVADDGSALAVGLADGTVKVYGLPSGKERLSVAKHARAKGGRGWPEVSAVKFVNGGRQILSAGRDNRQVVWDARTGADVAALDGHGSWVEAVVVSPDGKRVATAGQDSLIRLWDTATWKPVLPPEGPHETVWRLETSRDGKFAAAGSGTGVHVWDLNSGREVRSAPSDHRNGYVLFSPDGAVLAGDGKGGLSLYPVPSGESKPLAATGRLLDFTPDGRLLLTAEGATAYVWDWPACTRRWAVPVKAEVHSAAISADGRTAVLGLSGQTSAVLNLQTGAAGELPAKLHWFSRAAGFTAGGRLLCGTDGSAQAETWGVPAGGRVRQFEQPPHRAPGHFYILSLAVSPDGRKAATSHSDGGLAVYETATGQVLAHFEGHRDCVISVAWAGGNRVLTAGGDHQVLVWDVSLRKLAGKVSPLPVADRAGVWERLGTVSAKEGLLKMAALAADTDGAVALIADRLKPVPAADAATLDRIIRDLDDRAFAVRERASRELNGLGPGAIAGVRERAAKASPEVRGRTDGFLRQFEAADPTSERVRWLRALEVLAAADTPAARRLVERLAGGAPEVWETEAAQQALRAMPAVAAPK